MEHRCLFILVWLLLCLGFVLSSNYINQIRVSKQGNDSTCLQPNHSCKTLDYVFTQIERIKSFRNSTEIVIEGGVYTLNRSHSFEKLKDFQIKALQSSGLLGQQRHINEVVIQCSKGAGLTFLRCENLVFSLLTFKNCGSWQNNTSINNPKFLVAIFIAYSKNLRIEECMISKSPGVGVNMYDVGGDVFIENSMFRENYAIDSWNFTYTEKKVRVGGGLHIEMTYCGALYPFDCRNDETEQFNNRSNYTIRNCSFVENNSTTGHIFNQTFDTTPCGKYFNSIGRGGGISYIVKGNATGNQFLIDNCTFLSNAADWGAGYAIYFQDNASNNSLRVTKTWFLRNTARYGGGAVKCMTTMFGTFEDLMKREANHHLHENCTFEGNSAIDGWGGAFSAFGSTNYLGATGWKAEKTPAFVNCFWRKNSATVGAAIGVLTKPSELWRKSVGLEQSGFGFAIKLVNNTFIENFIIPTNYATIFGMGTIYTVLVPVLLVGEVKFSENSNTALVLDSACVEIDGNVSFSRNNGVYGGAVGVYGTSAFVFKAGAFLTFQENVASVLAGAIYVRTAGPDIAAFNQTIFQRHHCFFRYFNISVAPNDWNTSVVFRGNNASLENGRTLFANTLQFCRYGSPGLINDAIKSWRNFRFENLDGSPSNDDLEIATEPVQISFNPVEWNNIAPNEEFSPSIQLLDERNHSVNGLVKISIKEQNSKKPVKIEDGISGYFYVKDRIKSLWLNGKPSSKFDASISSIYSQSINMNLQNLTLKKCPPGFFEKDNTCICSSTESTVVGVSRCAVNGKSVYLRKGYWGGPSNDIVGMKCLFSVVQCPYGYCNCTSNVSDGLSNHCECFYDTNVDQCVKGRTGILCGECKEGLSAVIGSYECHSCNKNSAIMLIPFFFLLTLIVFIILFFKIDFFSGYLNCYLYTYQIIFLLLPDDLLLKDPVANFIVKLTNSRFVFGNWCLWNGMNDLQKTSFGYVAPLYQVFVLFVFAKLSSRFSVFQGNFFRPFCTILVISYSAIVDFTFKQLQPIYICSEWRVYIFANMGFFKSEHIIHGSIAIVVLMFVIFPFPLLLAFSSFFTSRSRRLFLVITPLLDVLKSCYYPKRSWFAAYYIVCRLLAVLIHTYILDINTRHKTLQMFCVAVFLLFLYLKPYKSDILTKIDTFFLAFLVLVSLLTEVVITCSFFEPLFYNICYYSIHILLYVPFVYCIILLYYHGRNLMRLRRQNRQNSAVADYQNVPQSPEASNPRYEPL